MKGQMACQLKKTWTIYNMEIEIIIFVINLGGQSMITLDNVCSVHRGNTMSTLGGYHEYIRRVQ